MGQVSDGLVRQNVDMTPDPEYAMLELGAVVTTGSWTEVTDFARRRKDALRPEYKHQVSVVRLMPVVWS